VLSNYPEVVNSLCARERANGAAHSFASEAKLATPQSPPRTRTDRQTDSQTMLYAPPRLLSATVNPPDAAIFTACHPESI
jgi:hypothetical protein